MIHTCKCGHGPATHDEGRACEAFNCFCQKYIDGYQIIVSDCPWRYSFSKSKSRKIENQYQTMTVADICALGSTLPIADNAVLYLWATAPKLLEALEVMKAWGFTYKSNAVWNKHRVGMGYWVRGQHELLLIGTRGKMSPPAPANRSASVIEEKRGKHSAKPEEAMRRIEKAHPDQSKLELFSRSERPGWTCLGHALGQVLTTDGAKQVSTKGLFEEEE